MSESTIVSIPVDELHPDPHNVRRRGVGDVSELAKSIAGVGVIEPLLVTPIEGGGYQVVAGHRRLAASIEANQSALPCVVRSLRPAEIVEIQLVENLQQSGLDVLDEAGAYLRLCSDHGYSIRKLAQKGGKSERHVRERLALLELPERAQDAIEAGQVSLSDAKALLSVKDRPAIIDEVLTERPGDVEWAVHQAVRKESSEQRRAALVAEHEERGVVVVADEGYRPQTYRLVRDLGLDEEVHQGEPCHAVVMTATYDGARATGVCTDRKQHTKTGASDLKLPTRSGDEEAKARARERRQAAAARAAFLSERLGRRLPKSAAVAFVVQSLTAGSNPSDAARAGRILGIEPTEGPFGPDWHTPLRAAARGTDADVLRAGVALAAASSEPYLVGECHIGGPGARYLGFLSELGYEHSDCERAALVGADDEDGDGSGDAPPAV